MKLHASLLKFILVNFFIFSKIAGGNQQHGFTTKLCYKSAQSKTRQALFISYLWRA